ncbi:P-loop containing nucleoside triphosphate hydrolase protein [Kockovaella imperatae]|uniref:p-loop containing nucleoside triphosphate hydrolase protein n=1 Tax=Kockovaella imperatae TaxID=4999 RepID=A0A1Y1UGX6_9TREE|nr:P-loop containing nucleoside triphosphate hydrolase protein [Kockovaella imperatae]ORX37313.1 P-loop containing nucleoside triphosphate hydrolase protein [Kockovaella imperatae]
MATSPAKRQLQDEDRDESEQGSSRAPTPVPKRVKREPSLARRASRGVSRAAGEPSATSDHDSESELDNSEYESELEAPTDDEEHFDDDEANVKAYEEAKAKTGDIFGWASDAGIIKQVILVDFMCHRHFSVELGNRMNFIVGHNGMLTGIAVALGGKAAVTGRGQGLKDLIRRDADKAVVTVIMSNEGPEAFKPELYGSQIVIERTLHKNGGSSYRFRATRDGKIIAQKRDELNEICANFSITIDSPLTILTQDAARSFLQNATDEMLYKFFLEGTGLDSLSAYYQKMQLQGEQLKNIADSQAEKIPLKEIEVDQLHRQVAASRRIVELQAKITRLTSELAWAYIRDKETVRTGEVNSRCFILTQHRSSRTQ